MNDLEIGAVVVLGLVVLVWIGATLRARNAAVAAAAPNQPPPALEPLAIPRGSVRAILGLLIVGEFIDFLLFGSQVINDAKNFSTVLAAFATLAGAVTGFYFGTRGATAKSSPPGP